MKTSDINLAKIKELESNFNCKVHDILLQEAKDNNPYKIGDIIEDHSQIGKIRTVSYGINTYSKEYQTIYVCDNLKKDFTIKKREQITQIYLCNVKIKHTKK